MTAITMEGKHMPENALQNKTLGQAINDLLKERGVKGVVVSLRGGPKWLVVTTYAVDDEGRHFVLDDGDDVATEQTVLRLDR